MPGNDCKECGPKKPGNVDAGYPTLNALKARIQRIAQGKPFFNPGTEGQWWLNMLEKPNRFEVPRKTRKDGFIWPYADHVVFLLNKFIALDQDFQQLIVDARVDNVFWHGEDRELFITVISETLKMRESDKGEYRQRAKDKIKTLTQNMANKNQNNKKRRLMVEFKAELKEETEKNSKTPREGSGDAW
jgi:hypothetical protein